MSDKAARSKQYEYRSNSNLVLQQDRENRPRENEPTGEVETLSGKIKHKMGDLAQPRQKDKDLEDKLSKMKKRANKKVEESQPKKKQKKEDGCIKCIGSNIRRRKLPTKNQRN